jgi:NADH:ubiquinone oxidoreductase subunit F (NADH-binding)
MFFDEDANAATLAKDRLRFFAEQSCGNCAPCREGLTCLLELLEACDGTPNELDGIEALGKHIIANARCGLGQIAPTPLLSALKSLRSDFERAGKEA